MTTPSVIDQLYRTHRRRALAIASRILRDSTEAEDVVQSVFTKLFHRGFQFDGKAAYTTWLHRVVVNAAINTLRARNRRQQLTLDLPELGDPEHETSLNESLEKVRGAIALLSPQHQQVLTLRDIQGHSYPEIAELTGLNEGTVKSALNRGRTKLFHALEEAGFNNAA